MLVTFKPIIVQGGRRRDGTWTVYIRVTFKGATRRIPTTLACTADDLTRTGKIKNATILDRGAELCASMREACADLPLFQLEDWTVNDVVAHIRKRLTSRNFSLDFFEFSVPIVGAMKLHTRATYCTALNALESFVGCRRLDVNDISKPFVQQFAASCNSEAIAARHLVKLRHLFNEAKKRYNDEDAGEIFIPRSPFADIPKPRPLGKAQKSQAVEVVQRIINAVPVKPQEALAFNAVLLSIATMGANLVDLYTARPFEGDVWIYNRHKTGMEARVRLEPEARAIAERLGAGTSSEWWVPALRRYSTPDVCTRFVNKYLREWQDREGIKHFTYYALRKSWGTWGRKLAIEKATIDEGLAHKGDWELTDIYAERNWELAWEANRRVLDLLDWGLQDGSSERSQQPR